MKVAEKIEVAKRAIASVTRHDDEPLDEITSAGALLQSFIAEELTLARVRRGGSVPKSKAKSK